MGPKSAGLLRRTLAATLLAVLVGAPPAMASRGPSAAEEGALREAALADCNVLVASRGAEPCEWRGARVSTANERYAWGSAVGDTYSGTLLRRSTSRSLDFRVVGAQGGGIGECRGWWRVAPRRAVADLRIVGTIGRAGLPFSPCPSRAFRLRRCGTVPGVTEGVRVRSRVTARGVGCRFARRTVRANNARGTRPRGWSCTGSGAGSLCVRGDVFAVFEDQSVLPYIRHVGSRTVG